MAIRIFKVLGISRATIEVTMVGTTKLFKLIMGGDDTGGEIKKQRERTDIVEIDEQGKIIVSPYYERIRYAKKKKSYWYCFLTSLDREQDISILKEILFWGTIYHNNDSDVEILIPGWAGERYDYYRRLFKIDQVPSLILTDNKESPVDFILISKKFINTEYLGDNFVNLRELLDFLHNLLINESSLKKINKELFKKQIQKITKKTWDEIKDIVSLNIR